MPDVGIKKEQPCSPGKQLETSGYVEDPLLILMELGLSQSGPLQFIRPSTQLLESINIMF